MLLIALTSLIVVGSVLYVVFVEKEDIFTRKICQISVYFSDQTIGVFQKLGIGGIYCKTYYKEFKDLKKEEFLEKTAENMRQCWWMWGEGKRDPTGPNLVKWSDYQCFNCYVIEPLDDVPEITLEDLETYLQKEYIKNSDTIYWNYFKGFNNNGIIFNFPSLGNPNDPLFKQKPLFEREKFYSVAFVEDTQPSVIARFLGGGAVGTVVSAVVCFPLGGPLGSFVCGVGGGLVGSTSLSIFTVAENYFEKDADAIMISEFDERENVCSGDIE